MSLKKFNDLFGIKEDIAVEKARFVERINQTIFYTLQSDAFPDNYENVFRDVCYQAGLNGRKIIDDLNYNSYGGTYIPSLEHITSSDFLQTLKILVILYNSLNSKNIIRLNRSIELALSMATIDLGVRWKDGLFYPSGAKELDDKLINENLDWLSSFSEAKNFFQTSLNHFNKSLTSESARKDAVTNAYSSMEALEKKILNNSKNFDVNSNELVELIKLPTEYKNIVHYYKQIAHSYSSRHAGSEFSHEEAEAFIYLTGILMRLLSSKSV